MDERAAALLPHRLPESPYARLLLFGIRRMAGGGLNDAHATHAFLTGFGLSFRRPVILLRAFMAEAARVASIRLLVAPCCCPRMTNAEHNLIGAITIAIDDPQGAHDRLAALLHVRDCLGLVTSAQAVASGFADNGMPLTTDCISCNSDEPFITCDESRP
jgi:hypothetical protein